MKLNLLPPYVSKGKQSRGAIILMVLILLASILAALGMMFVSKQALQREKDRADQLEKPADDVVALSKLADTVTNNARHITLNVSLAEAMKKHNSAYPDFYDSVRPYIPSFFRTTAMTATPLGEEVVSLSLTGVIQTQQQYADLMLALNRIPGVVSVSRAGYQIVEQYVPNLTEVDQTGRPIQQGEQRLPDDPLERLQAMIARGGTTGFTGTGGFGSGEPGTRGAMPGWSQITMTVVLPGKLQTPNPRATLASAARIGSATGTTTAGRSSAPGVPGNAPYGPGGSYGMPPGATPGGGGGGAPSTSSRAEE